MSAKRRAPNDLDETGAPSNVPNYVSSASQASMSIPDDEPSLRSEEWKRKRLRLSMTHEEGQDSAVLSTLCCMVRYSSLILNSLREDEDSQSMLPNHSVTHGRDLLSTAGPSFFQDASHVNANSSFLNAVGRDQHINITTKTDPGTNKLSTIQIIYLL